MEWDIVGVRGGPGFEWFIVLCVAVVMNFEGGGEPSQLIHDAFCELRCLIFLYVTLNSMIFFPSFFFFEAALGGVD